ncbi:MAG TPA: EF-hand domain-containing protein [Candidatus Acidoferrum sp.]|nr:EF-hand domain-containing protein [Candidatus Acidoferrum sp.]
MRLLSALLSVILLSTGLTPAPRSTAQSEPVQTSPAIVIGFVGGFIKHDDMVHSEVQLGALLRAEYATGVHVQVFGNHHGDDAFNEILRLLDVNGDGKLSAEEKSDARIVIYGHSWGGSETVALARRLQKDAIPVLLTVQVDSVQKPREDDSTIPANVEQAVNFYQTDGLVHGRQHIRAENAERTQILGNFRISYQTKAPVCQGYPWFASLFEKAHIEIECDPNVWNQVGALIRARLPQRFESHGS